MQDLQREEMYCRNRSSAGAEVGGHWTLSSEYGALSNEHWVVSTAQYCSAVIFTQISAEYDCQPAHIFTSFSIQVSRDCFVLQWFEDKLGCHGKHQKNKSSLKKILLRSFGGGEADGPVFVRDRLLQRTQRRRIEIGFCSPSSFFLSTGNGFVLTAMNGEVLSTK